VSAARGVQAARRGERAGSRIEQLGARQCAAGTYPPTTRTLSSGSSVAVCIRRAAVIDAAARNVPVPGS
jgi:hypothetical protein